MELNQKIIFFIKKYLEFIKIFLHHQQHQKN